MHIRIGTRKSQLASWQANWVAEQLRGLGASIEMVPITTSGDVLTGALSSGGGQGLFTKEIQSALLDRRCDLAVHSLKDLPTKPTPGLQLGAVPRRAPVADALLTKANDLASPMSLMDLPTGAVIGTGSARRIAQVLMLRPDLQPREIRGNLDTRIRKLDDGEYDAILLAQAGLERLGWSQRISQVLPFEWMLPAAGQGALGLEIREEENDLKTLLQALNDADSLAAVMAERALLRELNAGCLAPIGTLAHVTSDQIHLRAIAVALDGSQALRTTVSGRRTDPEGLGRQAANQLRLAGVAKWLT